jgi:PEP-CTERM motif
MKFSRLSLIVALFTLVAVPMFATRAKADGVPPDPHFVLDTCAGCDAAAIVAVGTTGTISEAYTDTQIAADFEYYTGGPDTQDLTLLQATITGAPEFMSYQCVSNVFPDCTIVEPPTDCNGVTCTLLINYLTLTPPIADPSAFDELDPSDPIVGPYGDAIFCNNNGHGLSDCSGFISPGQVVSMLIVTPEPSSILLLVVGLVAVLGFGRKRWGVGRAA